MKYLKYLQTIDDFESFKNSEDYILPNVSYVEETKGVSYTPSIKIYPNNVITYKATNKLIETHMYGVDDYSGEPLYSYGVDLNKFGAKALSHEFSNGEGVITFESDVTVIGTSAFRDCSDLTEITIPASVTSIEYHAFVNCTQLSKITCLAVNAPSLTNYSFSNISLNGVLRYPTNATGYDGWRDTMDDYGNYTGYGLQLGWVFEEM